MPLVHEIAFAIKAAKLLAMEEMNMYITLGYCKEAVLRLGLAQSENAPGIQPITKEQVDAVEDYPILKLRDELRAILATSPTIQSFILNLGLKPMSTQTIKQVIYGESRDLKKALATVKEVQKHLSEMIYGQESAIETVCDGLIKRSIQAGEHRIPTTFLFVGPSACGKTMMARELAHALGDEWKFFEISMQGLTDDSQSMVINGLHESYQNAGPGKVTNFVRQHPKSVVVFDNFDKAHPNVRNVIEPVFTTGVITDEFGFYERNEKGEYDRSKPIADPEVSFSQSILIFTTTAGDEAYNSPAFQKLIAEHPEQTEKIILKELAESDAANIQGTPNKISPAFQAGLAAGSTALFASLGLDGLSALAERQLKLLFERLAQNLKTEVVCEDLTLLAKALVLNLAPDANALSVTTDLPGLISDPLMDHLRESGEDSPALIRIELTEDAKNNVNQALLSFGNLDPVKELFRKSRSLELDFRTTTKNDQLILVVSGGNLTRVTAASDFRGDGGLRSEVPEISFSDIAGHHQVKERLKQIIRLLQRPDVLKETGVGIPKGLLLYGEPGTGKTLLAKALAHEADLPFISTTGSELLRLEFVKTIFKRARKYAPSILFIDEIDAIGKRGHGGADIIINQLLTEIDGFDTSLSAPVFIIAATNLPEKVDDALIRSGRIDLHIEVPMLDRDARRYFVDRYFQLPHDGSLDREKLLDFTAGMTGADLEKVRREVVLEMLKKNMDCISMGMLLEQINTIKHGARSGHQPVQNQLQSTAYHEAGHAIVSMVVNPDVNIEQVTIAPRGVAAGFVSYDLESLRGRSMNKAEILDQMAVSLAGRIAQSRQFPDIGNDSGAGNDLMQANRYAEWAIRELGLDEEVGNRVISDDELSQSPDAANLVFARKKAWLESAEEQCRAICEKHWDKIDLLARKLLEKEVILGEELRQMFPDLHQQNS
ncbi:AAA family ATPase [Candidatus Parcubacteria bacterium]|nr:MAG: AAA family ATPase [Candidatus Parcubacteria bacterium]